MCYCLRVVGDCRVVLDWDSLSQTTSATGQSFETRLQSVIDYAEVTAGLVVAAPVSLAFPVEYTDSGRSHSKSVSCNHF